MASIRNLVLGQVFGLLLVPVAAQAQQFNDSLLETTLPPTYDRGRNVSVNDRRRPELEAIGVNLGGFTAFPSVQLNAGDTSNALLTETGHKHDGFASIKPRVLLQSNWSVHSLRLDTGANLVRYFDNGVRNEDGWYVSGLGRYDATPDFSLSLNGRTARQYESRFSSVAVTDARGASAYQTTNARLLAKYELARSRIMVAGNFNNLNYKDVELFNGSTLDQDNRDRSVGSGAVHYEYALTPDTGVFGEVTYTDTNYDKALAPGIANRDSREWKGVAGISFDLNAPFRGSLAIGYVNRDFRSATFRRLKGVSAAARLEYFPTELTTVTLNLRREVEDANITGTSGYFANAASLRVDHELLRNLILNVGGEYQVDDYIGIPANLKIFRVQGGGKYMIGNSIGLTADVRYSKRNSTVPAIGADIAERRAMIGVILQR